MYYFSAILGVVFAFFIVVTLHEYGHFIVARLFNIRVLRFSLGFGRSLFYFVGRSGCRYSVGWLPLGGYIHMYGEYRQSVTPELEHLSYAHKAVWKRMLVVLAGPAMNFVVAILLFVIVYSIGFHQVKPVVGQIVIRSLAHQAGLRSGDQIMDMGSQPISTWQDVAVVLIRHIGDKKLLPMMVKSKAGEKRVIDLNLKNWNIQSTRLHLFPSIGFLPYTPPMLPVVATVEADSPAASGGLLPGDHIVSMMGKPIERWSQVLSIIQAEPDQIISLSVDRKGRPVQLKLLLGRNWFGFGPSGYLGIAVRHPTYPPEMIRFVRYPLLKSWLPAFEQTKILLSSTISIFYNLCLNRISIDNLAGPIAVFKGAAEASLAGMVIYLSFVGFLSICLGFFNLLPIPALDGGHFLFHLIELIRGRAIADQIQFLVNRIGFIIILTLIVWLSINDMIGFMG